ncbi:hypothetical protein PchlR47_31290 [Pseudomonas chlororaphis]|nr:hypothetical protein PchlR47_31290 [Pseudomonas chlororaphis]
MQYLEIFGIDILFVLKRVISGGKPECRLPSREGWVENPTREFLQILITKASNLCRPCYMWKKDFF